MAPAVLSELRLLASARLDSHILLTIVLAGDGRLAERLRSDEFLPLGSRMRVRLALDRAAPTSLPGPMMLAERSLSKTAVLDGCCEEGHRGLMTTSSTA